jgi:acetyl-CoA decarbonylase/synthase complex subunit delta
MPFLVEKNTNTINEVVLGSSANGGTRTSTVTLGGEGSLPFQYYEGAKGKRPVMAFEVWDTNPPWPASLKEAWGSVLDCPVEWAKKAVELGAEMIHLKLMSINPDEGGRSVDDCVKTVGDVLKAVGVPLAVQGCNIDEFDKPLIQAVGDAFKGENLLLGLASLDNYATFAATALANGHSILTSSPLDINLCKQLHILLTEMNVPLERLVMDPSIGGLGYGLEYSYSILERGRIGALQGDKTLAVPVLGFIGQEAWKAKEAQADTADFPKWGEQKDRGILWEVITATALLQSGLSILVMRHPEAMKVVREYVEQMMADVKAS